MTFENPQILLALTLLGIPVLIHFLNFRRTRTIYFSSLKFLREIESTHRSRKNLQDLILLLLRLLVFALIIFAFAKPVKLSKGVGFIRQGVTGIFVDNSESMGIPVGDATVLEMARRKAINTIRSYPPDQKFFLLSNDNHPELQGISDAETTIEILSGLQTVKATTSAARILTSFTSGIERAGQTLSGIWLFSDFSKNAFLESVPPDTTGIPLYPAPVRADAAPNICIDSCWFANPIHRINETNIVTVRIRNFGWDNMRNLPVRLYINDTLRNEILIELEGNASVEADIPFTIRNNGWQKGKISISDYPYEPDNELLFVLSAARGIPVLQLYDNHPNRFFSVLFTNDPFYKYEEYPHNGFPMADFSEYSLVVLTGIPGIDPILSKKLAYYLEQGGTIWFFPEIGGEIQSYNGFLSTLGLPIIQSVNIRPQESAPGPGLDQWLKTVIVNPGKQLKFPTVNKSFDFGINGPERLDILNTLGGSMLISQHSVAQGKFILNAFPLAEEAGDLMYHPIFIPLTLRFATMASIASQYYHILGSDTPAEITTHLNTEDGVVKLIDLNSGEGLVPEIKSSLGGNSLIFTDEVKNQGFWVITQNERILQTLALNSDRLESDLSLEPDSLIKMHFASQGWSIPDINKTDTNNSGKSNDIGHSGKPLWHLFLIAALLFLGIESFVMQRKK